VPFGNTSGSANDIQIICDSVDASKDNKQQDNSFAFILIQAFLSQEVFLPYIQNKFHPIEAVERKHHILNIVANS
jgi:hypothetical protein